MMSDNHSLPPEGGQRAYGRYLFHLSLPHSGCTKEYTVANRHNYPASSERYQLTDIDGKMLLSGLVLSRWCEYHLMQWSLSRKMTSNRARYLNQDLIVLVRCRKPVIFRVGICVGIGWCCLLLTILNHEVKSHV